MAIPGSPLSMRSGKDKIGKGVVFIFVFVALWSLLERVYVQDEGWKPFVPILDPC